MDSREVSPCTCSELWVGTESCVVCSMQSSLGLCPGERKDATVADWLSPLCVWHEIWAMCYLFPSWPLKSLSVWFFPIWIRVFDPAIVIGNYCQLDLPGLWGRAHAYTSDHVMCMQTGGKRLRTEGTARSTESSEGSRTFTRVGVTVLPTSKLKPQRALAAFSQPSSLPSVSSETCVELWECWACLSGTCSWIST